MGIILKKSPLTHLFKEGTEQLRHIGWKGWVGDACSSVCRRVAVNPQLLINRANGNRRWSTQHRSG